jgi:hypothetical protein
MRYRGAYGGFQAREQNKKTQGTAPWVSSKHAGR